MAHRERKVAGHVAHPRQAQRHPGRPDTVTRTRVHIRRALVASKCLRRVTSPRRDLTKPFTLSCGEIHEATK